MPANLETKKPTTRIGRVIPDAFAEHQEKKNVTSQEDIPWNSGISYFIFYTTLSIMRRIL